MKALNKILATAFTGLLLVGCNDLDTEPLGSTITANQKDNVYGNDPTMIEAGVNSIATSFSSFMKVSGSNHNDFGYPSIMLQLDHRGTDLRSINTGYNWFTNQLMLWDNTTTSFGPSNVWINMYDQIYTANAVLKSIDPETEDPTEQFYMAQALAFRAYDYFILAQLFQFNYVGNQDKPCVPIVTNLNEEEVANAGGIKRSTVEEVYTQIYSDIDQAITLLSNTSVKPESGRAGKKFISLATAYGIRARVNLTTQKWDAAANDAAAAIANTSAVPYARADVSKPSFASADDNAWMWAIVIEEGDRVVTSGIVNWPSHMGSFSYGYASVGAWRACNKKLYNSISGSDVRKGWWVDADGKSANLSIEQQTYIDDAGVDPYTQVKFAPYKDELGTSTNANDIPLMRVEEMYLILAEAQAMGSVGYNTGIETLKAFVTRYRDSRYAPEVASAEEAQQEIYRQRRIELWGEGLSYFDILRLGVGIDRRGGGFEATSVFKISPDDPVLIYPIPNSEVEANDLLGENNPFGTDPTPVPDAE